MPAAVLLIGFNRPDLVAKQLNQLALCGVKELYVALDGPREGNVEDQKRCAAVREIVTNHPQIEPKKILEHKSNLGCAKAPPIAISWFLNQVGEGIVLEDDCYPDPSFFNFCEYMLKTYRKEKKIFSISGSNWFPKEMQLPYTHFFSIHPNIWGWATWQRAWEHYDSKLLQKSPEEWNNLIEKLFENVIEQRFWKEILKNYLKDQLKTWDYAFVFSSWHHEALHVISAKNLIINLGFRSDATHTYLPHHSIVKELDHNYGPYQCLPIKRNEFLDRVIFSERIYTTLEWCNWLFCNKKISKLEQEIEVIRNELIKKNAELSSFYGFTGAIKSILRRIKREAENGEG